MCRQFLELVLSLIQGCSGRRAVRLAELGQRLLHTLPGLVQALTRQGGGPRVVAEVGGELCRLLDGLGLTLGFGRDGHACICLGLALLLPVLLLAGLLSLGQRRLVLLLPVLLLAGLLSLGQRRLTRLRWLHLVAVRLRLVRLGCLGRDLGGGGNLGFEFGLGAGQRLCPLGQ